VPWALLNLVLSLLGVVLALILLVVLIVGRKKKDENQVDAQQATVQPVNVQQTDTTTKQFSGKHWAFWAIALIAAAAACVLFILTENVFNPMIIIDQWTIWHVIIFAVGMLFFILGMIKSKTGERREQPVQTQNPA